MAIVDIRLAALDPAAEQVEQLAALIAPEERERAALFRQDRDRRRFIVRRGRLRQWLSPLVGEAPEALRFATGLFGKPELAGGGPRFSLSHSGERMMLATAGVEVGCDIERVDEALDWRPLADRLFAPAERTALAALNEPRARAGFFACWARKEAFVKALGQGLSYPLDVFAVSVDEDAVLLSGGEGWAIAAIAAEPGHAGAVVARDDGTPLEIRISRPDER